MIGVDMTPEMVQKARGAYASHVAHRPPGADEAAVDFRTGVLEELPVGDGEADVVISNCVINLCDDKVRLHTVTLHPQNPTPSPPNPHPQTHTP